MDQDSETSSPSQDAEARPKAPAPTVSNISVGLMISGIVAFLVLLNAVSLLARFDWRWDLLTHFRFQYLVVFAVATPSLWLLRWRRMAMIAMAGLLLNAWFVLPIYLPSSDTRRAAELQADAQAPSLMVLHFNVHTSNARKQDVAAMIQTSGADVVFLQEINRAWVDALDAELAGYESVLIDPRSDNFGIGMWLRAGSVVTVRQARLVDVSDGRAQVNAIDATLEVSGGASVRILAMHTLPPLSGDYASARDAQLAGAGAVAQSTQGPFVLIGDLNATPWSASYRRLVKAGGLTDSLRGRAGWPTHAPGASWPAGLVSLGMIPIDHCLTAGGAVVVERRLGDATGSDHQPMMVEVGLVD
ncbi:MAG: endonuclease/exonuclease/phosphatase family protein [Phycisphaerales bacterium JB063]